MEDLERITPTMAGVKTVNGDPEDWSLDSEIVPAIPKCRRCDNPASGDDAENVPTDMFFGGKWETWNRKPDSWLCVPCFQADEHEQALKGARGAVQDYRERSHLPKRLAWVRLDTFTEIPENAKALRVSRGWLNDPTRNLLIVGPVASGKTYLALVLMNELAHQSIPIPSLFLSEPKMFELIFAGFKDSAWREEADRLIEWAKRAPLLVLDDLGKTHSKDSSWIEGQLYLIVDHRYNEQLPIVVTSEYASKGLIDRVGASVVSRLEHDALVTGLKKPAQPWRRPLEVTT